METDIESGMRWGELTETRVGDLDFATCILTVSRAVVELAPDDHPDGGRFLVKDYPKDKEYRRFKLSTQITAKIQAHVAAKDSATVTCCSPTGRRSSRGPGAAPPPTPSPGMTEPNENGRRYRHGTLPPTTRRSAGASTAAARTPTTAQAAGPLARTALVAPQPGTPTGISRPTGSATRSGARPRSSRARQGQNS